MQQEKEYPYEPEFSLKKLFNDRLEDVKYVLQYKKSLALVIIAGALAGAFIAWRKRPTYTARLTFVIDDSKSGSLSGLSSLAGQFGFNLDGMTSGNGVLAGDNVQELLKSTKLIKATLLSPYDAQQTLADKYVTTYKLDNAWASFSPDGKMVKFPANGANNSRLQDSLLHEITILILGNGQFGIGKTDKKLAFFEVNATMKDEKLAQLFCTRMIKQATDFYISTKTQRLRTSVNRLQHRADSIGVILNKRTYSLSAANQSLLDLNPAYTSSPNANIEVKQRDKIVLTTVFSETVKNLEASKAMLAQETPTVQIVDEPELPLKKNKLKYTVTVPAGIIGGIALLSLYVLIFRRKKA